VVPVEPVVRHLAPGRAIAARIVMEPKHTDHVRMVIGPTVAAHTNTVVMPDIIGTGRRAPHARRDIIARDFRV